MTAGDRDREINVVAVVFSLHHDSAERDRDRESVSRRERSGGDREREFMFEFIFEFIFEFSFEVEVEVEGRSGCCSRERKCRVAGGTLSVGVTPLSVSEREREDRERQA